MKIRGSVVSLSFIFPHPPDDEKKKDPHKKIDIYIIFSTKIDKVDQEIKEKLDRSASKLDGPTPEMPGMHQPSAFSRKV